MQNECSKSFYANHDPIILNLFHVMKSMREFRFRFETTWLKEASLINEVKKFWYQIPTTNIVPKLMSIFKFMEKWGRDFFNKFREKSRVQNIVMDDLKERTDARGIQQYVVERDKLNEILFHEKIY